VESLGNPKLQIPNKFQAPILNNQILDGLVKSKEVCDCRESGTQLNEKSRMPLALGKLSAG